MTVSWRDGFVDAAAFCAIALVAITECLSQLNALTSAGVIVAWSIVAAGLAGWFRRKGTKPALIPLARVPKPERDDKIVVAFMAFISAVCLYLALASPPNFSDAQSYHLPRVLRWIQDGAVSFYPTHIPRQLWIGPGWEYFQLHLQLLTGTDALANTLQWLAFIASPVVMTLIARELGAAKRGQLLAALFCLTIPMGIVQASGSQVDLFAGFWLAVSVALLLRIKRQGSDGMRVRTAVLFGGAVGIAVLSKATNALFLLPFVVWAGTALAPRRSLRMIPLAAIALAVAGGINAAQMLRNNAVFGNPLGGPDAASVTNQIFGARVMVSNIVRNAAIQLNTPSDTVNARVTRGLTRGLALVGIDANDRRTTFADARFELLPEWDDEGISTNQLHFLLIIATTVWLTVRNPKSGPARYLFCVLGGALLFCFFLKWQPWLCRLHLPLFMIAAPAVAASMEKRLTGRKLQLVAIALALTALHPTFRNALRPIVVRHPLFTIPYERRLFQGTADTYMAFAGAADAVASRQCTQIGIIETPTSLEYQHWKLLERRLGTPPELRHIGVTNSSRHAASHRDRTFKPCVIIRTEPTVAEERSSAFMKRLHPEGIPQVPPGYSAVWQRDFITVFAADDT